MPFSQVWLGWGAYHDFCTFVCPLPTSFSFVCCPYSALPFSSSRCTHSSILLSSLLHKDNGIENPNRRQFYNFRHKVPTCLCMPFGCSKLDGGVTIHDVLSICCTFLLSSFVQPYWCCRNPRIIRCRI